MFDEKLPPVEVPPRSEGERFKPVLVTAPTYRRVLAKLLDAIVSGATSWGFSFLMPMPYAVLIGVGWFMLCDWSGSWGKWLFRIKVVMLDGAPVGAIASLLRNLVLGLPTIGRAFIVSGWSGATGDAAKWDRGLLACVGLAVAFGELLGMVIDKEGRRWSDRFAGTRVVER